MAVDRVGNANPDGVSLGLATTEKVGFYGTAVVQPASANQLAFPAGTTNSTGVAVLTHFNITTTPVSVVANSVVEQTLTVTGILSTDFIFVNKPTSQAGLGVCQSRVSAANTYKMAYANVTAGTLTPTSEANLITTLGTNLLLQATLTPAAVAANTVLEQTFTVPGLAIGMLVQVNKPATNAGIGILTTRVTANNTLGITFYNATAATLTPTGGEAYQILALNGLAAASQVLQYGVNSAALLAGVITATTSEQTLTEAGLLSTDIAIGIQKPTTQAGLIHATPRVSAAAAFKLPFANLTAGTLTPTASELYQLTIFRASPASPMIMLTSATLTPTSVAANTTAEQTFTVTGMISGSAVAISPNFNPTTNTGIAGVRASATNTLALNFLNPTAGALVPTAGTYQVAQFQATAPTALNNVQQLVSPLQTAGASLLNAVRSAQVTMGQIAGA